MFFKIIAPQRALVEDKNMKTKQGSVSKSVSYVSELRKADVRIRNTETEVDKNKYLRLKVNLKWLGFNTSYLPRTLYYNGIVFKLPTLITNCLMILIEKSQVNVGAY